MLTKEKSKQVFKLKYLLLLPLVFGMLIYTSSEAQNKPDDNVKDLSQSDDDILIAEAKKRIEKEVDKLGSLREVQFSHLNRSHIADSDGPIVSKEEYFESALLFRMLMLQMAKDMAKEKNTQGEDYSSRIPLPSTARYESYVSRKEAFQILDENLKFSIKSESKNIGYDIRKIEKGKTYSGSSFELKVSNVSDLTGKEIAIFNNKMDEIFGDEDDINSSLILKDNQYRFQIFATKPVILINTFPKFSSTKTKNQVDATNQSNRRDVPFATVDEVPIFPGCEDEENKRACFNKMMQKHISKNFNYPLEAQEKGIQGRVSILFTISQDGTIQNVRMRGPDTILEKEAARIISLLPKMTPGKQKGRAVNVPFSIPITFKLQGETDQSEPISLRYKGDNSKSPLVIVDGKESTHDELSMISPNDIATMNVLKGDVADNLYGEKGKNGVVVVNTKKHKIFDSEKIDSDVDHLVLIDGKVSSQEELNKMDENDIAEIRFYKDESAIRKYGEKGKNGVMEVLTKKLFISNPKLAKVHSQITALRKERSKLLEAMTQENTLFDDNPRIKKLDTQIDKLQREQDKLVREELKKF